MEINDTLTRCKEFLQKSSNYYSSLLNRKKRDIEIYSGNFWTDELTKEVDRVGRINRSFTMYQKYSNAIVSPFSKSPYHTELDDEQGIYKTIQEAIDNLENDNAYKSALQKAVRNACITGVGYIILSTSNNKICLENVRDICSVALDPNIQEITGADAEKGAVVNIISKNKAKRLYGDDVYIRDNDIYLSDFGKQWVIDNDSIAEVSYFEMNDQGTVDFWKLCGNKVVVNKIELPIHRIPIFRIAYNEIIRNNRFDYNGIVDMTYDLQFGLNIGYSTMIERMNRSPKANFIMHVSSIDGLEDYYRKGHTKEGLVYLYNGDKQPIPIVEQYQTADLTQTMQNCTQLMSSVIGVPDQGVMPSKDKTATEILMQQNSAESNVESLYQNAQDACREISKALVDAYCYQERVNTIPTFKLINGPEVITRNMKRRQELLAVGNLVDDRTRTIIAKHFVDTLDADIKDGLKADIIANNADLQFISDSNEKEDSRAVATLQNMSMVLDKTQDELERQITVNAELKKENDQLQLQLLNMKEQNLIDLQKHIDQMRLDNRKLDIEEAKTVVENQTKLAESDAKQKIEDAKLQKEVMSIEAKKLDIVEKAMGE
jgi:hypothetical protein